MATVGAYGEVTARHPDVTAVMDALKAIDGGEYIKPPNPWPWVKMIEERLKLTIEKIIAEALQAQDAETRQAQKEACAEAALNAITDYNKEKPNSISGHRALSLADLAKNACMNAKECVE
jgi:hypothetical protein